MKNITCCIVLFMGTGSTNSNASSHIKGQFVFTNQPTPKVIDKTKNFTYSSIFPN